MLQKMTFPLAVRCGRHDLWVAGRLTPHGNVDCRRISGGLNSLNQLFDRARLLRNDANPTTSESGHANQAAFIQARDDLERVDRKAR